jgi:hypothetical protein
VSAGKGDKFRPVKKKKYNENFEKIDWKKDNKKEPKKINSKLRYSY